MKEYKLVYLNKKAKMSLEKDLEQSQMILNQYAAEGWELQQIILRKGIPYSLTLPTQPKAVSEMTKEEFDQMIGTGLAQAKPERRRRMVRLPKSSLLMGSIVKI